jgi:thiamine kinase-like enzyme
MQNLSIIAITLAIGLVGHLQGLPQALLQQPIKEAVQSAVSSIAGQALPIEEIHFTELTGGMTSTKLYTFELLGKKYVLRILKGKHLDDKQNEVRAQEIAASMGIAPELTYVSEDSTLIVMPFIEGHTLTSEDLKNKDVVESLGMMLGKLHKYPGEFYSNISTGERVMKHYARALKKGVAFPSVYQALYEDYMVQDEILNRGDFALCHGDLNPANILITNEGRIYIIDWTSGNLTNLYTDLGYLTFSCGFNDAQSRVFLTAYFGHEPTHEEWIQFKLAQKRTCFVTASVWFDFSESEQDKSIPLADRVKALDALLDSKDLKLGQEYIAEGKIVSPTSGQHEAIKLVALGFLKSYLMF